MPIFAGLFHVPQLLYWAEISFYSPNSHKNISKGSSDKAFVWLVLFLFFLFFFFPLCENIYLLLAKSLSSSDKIGHCIEKNFFIRKRQIGLRFWFLNTNIHAQNNLPPSSSVAKTSNSSHSQEFCVSCCLFQKTPKELRCW